MSSGRPTLNMESKEHKLLRAKEEIVRGCDVNDVLRRYHFSSSHDVEFIQRAADYVARYGNKNLPKTLWPGCIRVCEETTREAWQFVKDGHTAEEAMEQFSLLHEDDRDYVKRVSAVKQG